MDGMEKTYNFGEVIQKLNHLLNEATDAEFASNFQEFKELYNELEGIVLTNKGFTSTI